jgi:hypothetical protein
MIRTAAYKERNREAKELSEPDSDLFQTPNPKRQRVYNEPESYGDDIGPIPTDTDCFFDSAFVKTPAKSQQIHFRQLNNDENFVNNFGNDYNNDQPKSAMLFSGELLPDDVDNYFSLFSPRSGAGLFNN